MTPAVSTLGLSKSFGSILAVDGLQIDVSPGEILAILGPNGAGKTTTVRMLGSILQPTAGTASVAGLDVVDEAQRVRRRVGLLTEFPGLYLRMPTLEYLVFFGGMYGLPPEETARRGRRLLGDVGLQAVETERLGTFSKGMRQKVALVRALLHEPLVLLLDEPTSAMDPRSAKTVRDLIRELRAQGRCIVLCTHNLAEAEALADRIAIISKGRIVAQGTVHELERRLLGPPVFEVELARQMDGLEEALLDLVETDSSGTTWIRYRTSAPEETNPHVTERLVERGAEVVSLSRVSRSLEDVYLRIVEEADAG
ncbi:MAG: ABC transporter ATP-binding protein [Anaerolineae bacterium]